MIRTMPVPGDVPRFGNVDVDLYTDPSCPWCWTASQWLRSAARSRDLSLRLRPFSLAMLNKAAPAPVAAARRCSLGALRIATSLGDEVAFAFLDEFSRCLFDPTRDVRVPDLGAALERVGLPIGLAVQAHEVWRDDGIRASMQTAAELRGLPLDETTTVPIVVMHTQSGPIAVDGPLLDPGSAPSRAEAGALWDAFSVLVAADGMYGFTRPRRGPHSRVAGARRIETWGWDPDVPLNDPDASFNEERAGSDSELEEKP